MSSTQISVEEARKILGDLAIEVQHTGTSITLTRYGKPIARIAPLENAMTTTTFDNPHGYAAAIDATDLTSSSDTHEVWVLAYEPEELDENNNPMIRPSNQIAPAVSTGLQFGTPETEVYAAADRILADQGWKRTEDWRGENDAIYADVERA